MSALSLQQRKRFLQISAIALGVFSLLIIPSHYPLLAQTTSLQVLELSENIVVVQSANANVLAVQSNEGVIIVDGGHVNLASQLFQEIEAAFPAQPIRALFNSHWHPQQTGLNLLLGETGVDIIAHENTRLWLNSEVWVRWSDVKYPPLLEQALPNQTFYESGGLQFAELEVDYGYLLNAHTDGDIYVYFPQEDVLFTGGLVSNDSWPLIDWWTGGWTGGMLDGYARLLEVANENTRIVPASGSIMTYAELEAQHDMYLEIFGKIHNMLIESKDVDEIVAANPTSDYNRHWGNPTLFVTLAFQSLWGHLRDGAQSGWLVPIP